MVGRLDKAKLEVRGEVVAAPPLTAPVLAWQDYNFELPPVLHFVTAAFMLGFVAVLCLAFANPELMLPSVVFFVFVGAFFAIPAMFVRGAPEGSARARRWSELMERGIAVEHGRCGGGEAVVLVLLLPVSMLCWALAIATIAALV